MSVKHRYSRVISSLLSYPKFHLFPPPSPYRGDAARPPPFSSPAGTVSDTTNDHLLAMMLQLEYDKEHDTILKAEERAYNKDSKGQFTPHATSDSVNQLYSAKH